MALCSTSGVGQVNRGGELFLDSLYHHISREGSVSLSCRFAYAQGSFDIIPSLGNNRSELSKIDVFIRQATAHPNFQIKRIRLTGYSSIEGSYSSNEALSRERVRGFYQYLREHYPALYRYPHDMAWVAEDWDGLSKLVRNSNINERDEILEIIRKVSRFDEREALLVKLNGGAAYVEMERSMFTELRRVEIKVEYTTTASPQPSPKEGADSLTPALSNQRSASAKGEGEWSSTAIDHWLGIGSAKQRNTEEYDANNEYAHKPIRSVVASGSSSGKKTYSRPQGSSSLSFGEGRGEAVGTWDNARFALKTNMLLWAGVQYDFKHTTPVANVALEYYINKNWSIEAGAMYSYWRFNDNREFQGVSGYRLEPRFHLPILNDRLEAFIGVYGRVGDYDQRKRSLTPALSFGEGERTLRTIGSSNFPSSLSFGEGWGEAVGTWGEANWTGDYYDIGLSAGLSLHLVGGLGLEFGLRAGYVKTSVIKYTQDNLYNWFESRERYSKVKVTDLNVSLIYRFR